MNTQLLTGDEICSRLSISKATLYRLVDLGELPKPIKCGAASRWTEAAVIDLYERKCGEAA